MNLYEKMLSDLHKQIKEKKILQKDIALDLQMQESTVSKILSGDQGTSKSLNDIINYVSNKESKEKKRIFGVTLKDIFYEVFANGSTFKIHEIRNNLVYSTEHFDTKKECIDYIFSK